MSLESGHSAVANSSCAQGVITTGTATKGAVGDQSSRVVKMAGLVALASNVTGTSALKSARNSSRNSLQIAHQSQTSHQPMAKHHNIAHDTNSISTGTNKINSGGIKAEYGRKSTNIREKEGKG